MLWRMIKLIKTRRRYALYALLPMETICAGLLPFLLTIISKTMIDYLTSGTNITTLVGTITILFGLSLLFTVVSLLCNHYFNGAFVELRAKELGELQKKCMTLDYWHLEDPSFVNRIQAATDALSGPRGFENVYHNIVKLCPSLFSVILLCVVILRFQPLIALVCIFNTLIVLAINHKITKYVEARQSDRAKRMKQKSYYNGMGYDFNYGKDIRIFSLTDKLLDKYQKASNQYLGVIKDIANQETHSGIHTVFFIFIKDLLAFLLIVQAYYNDGLTLGEVTYYISMVIAFSTLLDKTANTILDLTKSMAIAKPYFALMDDDSVFFAYGTQNKIQDTKTLEIEFKDVSFRYPNTDQWVLRHFNLKIEAGEKIAIVGVNGAGKSTIVKLLTRLFPVTEGEILVNQININEFCPNEYADMFSAVYQDVKIYACSILENIIDTANLPLQRKRGMDCLKCVGLGEKVESLPHQYDTELLKVVDDAGIDLSGGQKQKIAICRALYKNANMIIMDEPTASLDALAESEIYQSFDQLVGGKTAIYISHRLSSTKFCDHILLLSQEGVLEYGNHDTLMAQKGLYFDMFQTQGKYYREDANQE